MKKWEYLRDWDLSGKKLDSLGESGWELVTTYQNVVGGCVWFVFKREKL